MTKLTKTIVAALLLSPFALANAGVVQVWECTLEDGKTEEDVMKASSAWLAAAKSMKGGSEFKAYHDFPIAANAGNGRFNFVLIAPEAESWGAFTAAYPGSAAADADEAWGDVATCSGSSLWSSVEVE